MNAGRNHQEAYTQVLQHLRTQDALLDKAIESKVMIQQLLDQSTVITAQDLQEYTEDQYAELLDLVDKGRVFCAFGSGDAPMVIVVENMIINHAIKEIDRVESHTQGFMMKHPLILGSSAAALYISQSGTLPRQVEKYTYPVNRELNKLTVDIALLLEPPAWSRIPAEDLHPGELFVRDITNDGDRFRLLAAQRPQNDTILATTVRLDDGLDDGHSGVKMVDVDTVSSEGDRYMIPNTEIVWVCRG